MDVLSLCTLTTNVVRKVPSAAEMPPDTPKISEAEWDVMNVVWEQHPITAQDVHTLLEPRTGWTQRTVKTLLSRLVKKRALGYEVDGKRYRYYARVSRDECVQAESKTFLERVLGGSASPALAFFVREGRLSPKEVEEIRRLLDDQENSR